MNQEDISKKIMDEIETGKLQMRPKSFFVARMLLWSIGLGICALSAVFIFSFIIFKLKLQGALVLPELGILGIRDLLLSLPFIIILYVLIFSLVLYWLVKHYAFSYRKPLVYTMLSIVGIVILGGSLVALTPLHSWAFKRFSGGGPGPFRFIYKDIRREPLHNGIMGEVYSIEPDKIGLITIFKKHCDILISNSTFFPNKEDLELGDFIIVRGTPGNSTFLAEGIKELTPDDHFLSRFPEMENHRKPKLAQNGCGQ